MDVEVDDQHPHGRVPSLHARAATAASLKTQNPSPWARCAWCVPPARFTPQPVASALRQAAMVAPAERRERSIIAGDHGNPMRFMARASSVPVQTAAI
jgi:hypothetical protein